MKVFVFKEDNSISFPFPLFVLVYAGETALG